jgi:hypothetical protein
MPKIEFPFLPIHLHTPNHPKILKFKRLHGPGSWHAIIGLWLWAAIYRPNGDLSGMEDEEIEAVAEWRGTPGSMVASMIDCALLDGERGFLRVHDWGEWQQHFVVAWSRSQTARRMRNLRRRRSVTGDAALRSRDSKVTPRGEKRREEERREEKKELPAQKAARTPAERDSFVDWACREHNAVEGNGGPESWKAWGKEEFVALALAVKRIGDVEARRRWLIYLGVPDAFYAGHLPRMFLSHLGKFTREPAPKNFLNAHTETVDGKGQIRSKYASITRTPSD